MTVYLGTIKSGSFRKRAKSKIKNKKHNNKPLDFSRAIFWLAILAVVSVLGYIFIVNVVATMGYEIKVTERKINELKNENDNLKIKISEIQSIKTLEVKAMEIGMREPEEIDYLSSVEGLALKD